MFLIFCFFLYLVIQRGKAWTVQLLAVACLSLAAKMDETKVPQSVDLQVPERNLRILVLH